MTVVKWAMFLAPWAVFGLMAQLVAEVGFGTILGLGVYVLTVLLGLLLLYILYLLLVAVLGKMNPVRGWAVLIGPFDSRPSISLSDAVNPEKRAEKYFKR